MFYSYNADGIITRQSSRYPDNTREDTVGIIESPKIDQTKYLVIDGELVEQTGILDKFRPSVSLQRKLAYPDIRDQLEAIWEFVSLSNDIPPKAQMILDKIKTIKEKYPKEEI